MAVCFSDWPLVQQILIKLLSANHKGAERLRINGFGLRLFLDVQ